MRDDHRLPLRETQLAFEVDWQPERKYPGWVWGLLVLVVPALAWGLIYLMTVAVIHHG